MVSFNHIKTIASTLPKGIIFFGILVLSMIVVLIVGIWGVASHDGISIITVPDV
jgi:hypothetical protein